MRLRLASVGIAAVFGVACAAKSPAPKDVVARSVAELPAAPRASASAGDAGSSDARAPAAVAVVDPDLGARPECAGPCTGVATPELMTSVRQRVIESKRCYDRALATDPGLAGSTTIRLVVDASGVPCSARVASSTFPDETVPDCVRLKLASSKYAATNGGACLEMNVPIKFVQQP